MLRLCVSMAFLATVASSSQPAFYAQVNQELLTYVKSLAVLYLNKELLHQTFPCLGNDCAFDHARNTESDGAHVRLFPSNDTIKQAPTNDCPRGDIKGLTVTEFSIPSEHASLTLQTPGGLKAHFDHVHLKVAGKYHVEFPCGFIHFTKSGDADATASLGLDLAVQLTQVNGRPQLTAVTASCSLSDFDINIHGGVVDEIINWIIDLFKSKIKDKIQDVATDALKKLPAMINPKLASIPISIDIADGFKLDYTLTGNPLIVGNSLVVQSLGRIWYQGHHDDPNIPAAHSIAPSTGSNKHVCLKLDGDAVLGSAGYAAQVAGIMHLDVTDDLAQKLHLANLLRCDCNGSLCLGTLFPAIKDHCSANGSVGLLLRESKAATANLTPGKALLNLFGQAVVYSYGVRNTNLIVLNVTASPSIEQLHIDNWTIKGGIQVDNATLIVADSLVGSIPQKALQSFWQLALKVIAQGMLNPLAQQGIPLPPVPDLVIQTPVINIAQYILEICADLKYTGPL